MSVSDTVRLICPRGRKRGELWGGAALAVLGVAGTVLSVVWQHWAGILIGPLVAVAGCWLVWDGYRIQVPVLEVEDGEFRYIRGRYIVRIPFSDIGSYYVLPGATRSLGLCDPAGRPRQFPSVEGRRASRPYLPLTGLTSSARVDAFMSAVGIPPRDRSLAPGRRR
ncbi:hypothetical protein ACFPZ0_07275 [Streptomonospora nanhaiensis]|uniref:hypothetical protein n=1 Tax=Streptomonospora nanhaiensis TaxID=1323731 RepID=UPI0015C7FB8F|nr:hypothetical protein [Streptomonospora nanhaiensis]MBV2362247.1 hypothetical protein [Streptomonospora nanhaiensis]MBX9387839.1 hypothetical protein [Streptomonospora nanhaiensis]